MCLMFFQFSLLVAAVKSKKENNNISAFVSLNFKTVAEWIWIYTCTLYICAYVYVYVCHAYL